MMYINGMYHTRRIKMEIAKVFQTGRSQAVRLPKAFRFNYFNCMSSAITLHRNDQEVRLNSVVY